MFDLRCADLARINSLTKYPSIPTYHALDPKSGVLLEATVPFTGPVLATEKIDGTNARLVCFPDGSYVLGSREELLYARGDLIGNPALGIVETLRPLADGLPWPLRTDAIQVCWFEVYGGKVSAASKQYTGHQRLGFRMFDAAVIPDDAELLGRSAEELSRWREAGGQPFLHEDALAQLAHTLGVALTPRIPIGALPTERRATAAFLREAIPHSLATLDAQGGARPEGLVVRTADRRSIAKLRFEDYERTLRRLG